MTCCCSSTSPSLSEVNIIDQEYQPLKSAKERLQHKLPTISSIVFERFILDQELKTVAICLLGYQERDSVALKTHIGQILTWRPHAMLSRNMWSLPSWLLQMCDVRAQRERGAICFGHEINLPCGTGAERSGSRHNKSNVTREPWISTSEERGEHVTNGGSIWKCSVNDVLLCQRFYFL